jgi:hypothetical protein
MRTGNLISTPRKMRTESDEESQSQLSAEEARHLLRNSKRTLVCVDGGFTRISDSDDSASEEDEERKEAPKAPKPKPKAKGKSAAEKKADELKEKKKEWLKKRVLLPDDRADGDAGTVVTVEQRAKTKKRKGGWWFKIDLDDAEEEDDIDPLG